VTLPTIERVTLIAAILALPLAVGRCSNQALQNESLKLDNEAKSQAIQYSVRAFAAKDSSLKVSRAYGRKVTKQLRACRGLKHGARLVLEDEPENETPEPHKSFLGHVGSVAASIGKTVWHLFGG
jgi:hypothetical protein